MPALFRYRILDSKVAAAASSTAMIDLGCAAVRLDRKLKRSGNHDDGLRAVADL
jgi:hypothetical protein